MDLQSIGENIRSYRKKRKWRQEDLAEKVDLSVNYISLLERGEKIPALDTFIDIVNVLGVTSDMVLTDVLDAGYQIKSTQLADRIAQLSPDDRRDILAVVDTMVRNAEKRRR
ncbi:MAG TPA: helix-turn-helix domain-containing protein [Candidatus Gemmiger stercoravium]|nr:helix-turn-helix domain-containing protein [Candidatus Merdibacter merdigallinarum]HJC54275.1 helix-turn-helix domain-containing protein [Candidatus Gemmiger stercoravium]